MEADNKPIAHEQGLRIWQLHPFSVQGGAERSAHA